MTSTAPRWGTSVVALYARRHPMNADPALETAVSWLRGIRNQLEKEQAPGMIIEQMVEPSGMHQDRWSALGRQILRLSGLATQVAGKHLQDDQRRDYLGGLPPGLTLIILCHGVEDDGGDKPGDSKSGGLALIERSNKNSSPGYRWLMAGHMSNMKVDGGRVVHSPANPRVYSPYYDKHSAELVDVVDALKRSRFDRIVLLACAEPGMATGRNRLDKTALFLSQLTGKTIYYNSYPLGVGTWTHADGTQADWLFVGKSTGAIQKGPRWTKPKQKVRLESKDYIFLPGLMHRQGGEVNTPVLDMRKPAVVKEVQHALDVALPDFSASSATAGAWDEPTRKAFQSWLDTRTPGYSEDEKQLLFHKDESSNKFPSARGAAVIYRTVLVTYRRDDSIPKPDEKAETEHPKLADYEAKSEGVGGGELIPPKAV